VSKHLQHSEILPIHTEHQALVVVFSGLLEVVVQKANQQEDMAADLEDLMLVVDLEMKDLETDLEVMEPQTLEVVEEVLENLLAVTVDRVLLWLHILPNK
tara:strand:+ start:559 stop:858 length:300 start_codon:yes stop_codon:yes gene_type:complete